MSLRAFVVSTAVLFLCAAGWKVGSTLSPDALGLAAGVLLGVLAAVPVSLLVLASQRAADRRAAEERRYELDRAALLGRPARNDGYGQPPPITVLMLPVYGQAQQPGHDAPALPAQRRLPAYRDADNYADGEWR